MKSITPNHPHFYIAPYPTLPRMTQHKLTMKDIDINTITDLQRQLTADWHKHEPRATQSGLLGLVEANHMNNFLLWHEEDRARRNDMGFEYVFHAKRAIDKYNQERNNCMERIDEYIHKLAPQPSSDCQFHTETPGMIIDRLSIMTLKQYHIEEETLRKDVDAAHKQKCQQRLALITQQLSDLKQSLQDLIDQVLAGKRAFRVYYQLKMYNDPTLNPELYNQSKK